MGNLYGHVFPGSLFLFCSLFAFCRDPLSNSRDVLAGGWIALIVMLGSIAGVVISEIFDGSRDHKWHHWTMYSAFGFASVASLLERRKMLADGAASILLCGAAVIEALLFVGHLPKTRLEGTCHWLVVLTALLSAAALGRLSLDPPMQWARVLALYFFALKGLTFIGMGIWLGLFFEFTIYNCVRNGRLFHTANYCSNGTLANTTVLHPFGPVFNTSDRHGVWRADKTSHGDIMHAYTFFCTGALALMIAFLLRWSSAVRGRQSSEWDPIDQAESLGVGAGDAPLPEAVGKRAPP